jgi:hypothetical protein
MKDAVRWPEGRRVRNNSGMHNPGKGLRKSWRDLSGRNCFQLMYKLRRTVQVFSPGSNTAPLQLMNGNPN